MQREHPCDNCICWNGRDLRARLLTIRCRPVQGDFEPNLSALITLDFQTAENAKFFDFRFGSDLALAIGRFQALAVGNALQRVADSFVRVGCLTALLIRTRQRGQRVIQGSLHKRALSAPVLNTEQKGSLFAEWARYARITGTPTWAGPVRRTVY